MTRLADITGDIANMGELRNIVSAMRSLAGMRVQEAQLALPEIRRYADSMAAAIEASLMLMPRQEPPRPARQGIRALVLCAAEHGFAGGFNERLVEAAEAELQPRDVLFVLGSRGAALALERGTHAAWARPMATRLAGTPGTVNQLTRELYARIARGEISRVEVMFSRYRRGGQSTLERRLLLPLDTASIAAGIAAGQPRQAPFANLEPAALFEKLAAEYVFALLTEAAVESIASENAARFSAMEAACDNVQKKLQQLQQEASQARQTEITTELLDLVTGAEALSGT
jgi:F-type H+-transporting ATPase subunit gamma